MLQRYLPKAARAPYPSVNSLPDWNYELRMTAALRDCFLQIVHDPLIESGSLGDLIDLGRFRALRDAFFAQRPPDYNGTVFAGSFRRGATPVQLHDAMH